MRGFTTGVGSKADIGPPAAESTLVHEYTTKRGYSPVKTGLRFSAKALSPSRWSALPLVSAS